MIALFRPAMGVFASAAWAILVLSLFFAARRLYLRHRLSPLHPVPVTVASILLLLVVTGYPRDAFRAQTQPVVWLLGTAVVSLAVPVWNRRVLILRNWRAMTLAVGTSLLLSTIFSVMICFSNLDLARAMGARAVTLPVAIAIARPLGTPLDLIVAGVMMSAFTGLIAGPFILALAGVPRGGAATGIALGCASHALGTARALEEGETAGAFASVAMCLSAIAYGVIMPFILLML